MTEWFESFKEAIAGSKASSDIIGAGTAGPERAMLQYRFQHQAKMREAVESTFPVLLRYLGESWQGLWNEFWTQNQISPRSLDWFSEVFVNYFLSSDRPFHLKELARFEHRMDIHPWSHEPLSRREGQGPTLTSKIALGNFELITFRSPVTGLYREENIQDTLQPETVILWQKEDGVYYRALADWEVSVLQKLPAGVGVALEEAPDDPEAVGEFFQWLGGSCLIQKISEDS